MTLEEWKSKDSWCLYVHTSPSGKKYVGITNDTKNRWRSGGIGYKGQPAIWNAIQKYGWDNFKHEIIEVGLTMDEAKEKEIALIKELKSSNHRYGYNISKGGDMVPIELTNTPEAKAKRKATWEKRKELGIHTANYGRKYSPELRQKLSDAHKGLPSGRKGTHLTDEQKEHLREVNLGKTMPEEIRRKISDSSKGKQAGLFHPMFGTHHSEEHRKNISEGLKRGNHPLHGLKGKDHPCYGMKRSASAIERTRMALSVPVLQYSLDFEFIKRWDSLTAIQNELHFDRHRISKCCKGELKKVNGYIWRYETDMSSTQSPPPAQLHP